MFNRKKAKPPAPPNPVLPEGWTAVLAPAALLNTPPRQRLLDRIWQYSALSEAQFERLYRRVLLQYADYVQLLPASEYHHHAYPGGLLDHGLELVATALKLRQSYLLPAGATPEDQAAQTDAWSTAIAYGALLHDIGKVVVDIDVVYLNGERWHPWQGPLRQPYRLRYRQDRQYELHGAVSGVLLNQILPADLLDWLSQYPSPWRQLLFAITGHRDQAGALGEIVSQADRISTAQNTGANPVKAMQAPARSLQHHLLAALRHLVKSELKLNQAGAAGWLTADALWLVSKVIADKIRAYLLAQSVDGVPSSNIALFDELQSHGLAEATSAGKAIWMATVTSGEWRHSFTVLKLRPALIWDPEDRPDAFPGSVEVVTDTGDTTLRTSGQSPQANGDFPMIELPIRPKDPALPEPSLSELDDCDQVEPVLKLLNMMESKNTQNLPSAPSAAEQNQELGYLFLIWLRVCLQSHALIINDSRAKVHTINRTYFLVTPGIFQRYVLENQKQVDDVDIIDAWSRVQKSFEKMNLHVRKPNGQNIWTCQVRGPRKRGKLSGYLIKDPHEIAVNGLADNSFLRLLED